MTDFFDIDWGMGPTETPEPEEPQDTQSEPRGRKTRSHLKAKVYETSDKFEYRRAFSENTVVTIDEGLYHFHKEYFDGIISIEK